MAPAPPATLRSTFDPARRAKGCATMTGTGMFVAVRERMAGFFLGGATGV